MKFPFIFRCLTDLWVILREKLRIPVFHDNQNILFWCLKAFSRSTWDGKAAQTWDKHMKKFTNHS
jgi:hypothetical protein